MAIADGSGNVTALTLVADMLELGTMDEAQASIVGRLSPYHATVRQVAGQKLQTRRTRTSFDKRPIFRHSSPCGSTPI